MDIKDTIRRLKHAGARFDLSENSNLVKLADVILSVERDRLDRAVTSTKKTLGDWAGKELDNFWGVVLGIYRLPGVEDVDEFIGDASYMARLKRFMEGANMGGSLEAVRAAAEAGSGVSIRVRRSGTRILLSPHQPLSASQKAGALQAVRRVAPARAIIEFNEGEEILPLKPNSTYSKSNYTGPPPDGGWMGGPRLDSDNMIQATRSNRWSSAASPETNGLPNNLVRGGVWHTPPLSFGERVTLEVDTTEEPFNRIAFEIGNGDWIISISTEDKTITTETIYGGRSRWMEYSSNFDFRNNSKVFITLTNAAQETQEIFFRGLYIGARVTEDNRLDWLALGGLEGESVSDVDTFDAEGITEGKNWIANPAPDATKRRVLYATLSEVPQNVTSLGFKTNTPGCAFKLYFSNEQIGNFNDYENLEWKRVPGTYSLESGKVKISPFYGRHIKMEISNLKPMMLRQFDEYGVEDD